MVCSQHQTQSTAALGARSCLRCATLLTAVSLGRGLGGGGTGECTSYVLLKLESVPERLGRLSPSMKQNFMQVKQIFLGRCKLHNCGMGQ